MYNNLKQLINTYITSNGQGEITGAKLNEVLNEIVRQFGQYKIFGGVINPGSMAPINDTNVFFFAAQPGNYSDFGFVLPAFKMGFVSKDAQGNWQLDSFDIGSLDYEDLLNLPQVNGVTLQGDKSAADLGLATSEQGAKADTAYQKPGTGIPLADLDSSVQDTLSQNTTDIEELKAAYEGLTQSNIVVVDDHTAVADPQPNTIYREQGVSSYSDWMYYAGSWYKMAEYNNAIDDVPTPHSNNLVKSGGVYSRIVTRTTDFPDADLGLCDENGYDIVRFQNGHIKTKNFNSNNIPEENLSPDVQAKINSSASSNIQVKNYSNIDLAFSDQAGYDIVRFHNGHIKTKNFDSENIPTPSGGDGCIQRHKPVIIDTDWRTDVDDCVMVRCAQWAEQCGMIDVIGYVLDLCNLKQLKSLSAFLDYEGRRGIAIGVDKNAVNSTVGSWQDTLLTQWPYNYYTSLDEADDAPVFYRKALKKLPAGKKADVVITGHCNAFARFLQSGADSIDLRTGLQMCEDLVDTVYIMGGAYPSGSEHNFNGYSFAITGAQTVANTCPVKVVYLGFEVGETVITGGTLSSTVGADDLLYKIMIAAGYSSGRSSWDPMTMMMQIIGGTYEAGYNTIEGTNTIASNGSNSWTNRTGTNQFYVVKRYPNSWFQYQINQIIEKHAWPWRDLGAISLKKL